MNKNKLLTLSAVIVSLVSLNTLAVKEVTTEAEFKTIIANNEKVVVDFYATWCGPCRQLLQPFAQASQDKTVSDVMFIKVNVDTLPDLTDSYDVQSLPSVILIQNGKEVNRKVGLKPSIKKITTWIKSSFK